MDSRLQPFGSFYSQKFLRCMDCTMLQEGWGKVSDDPRDPGGFTKWGIALKRHPEFTREQLTNFTLADVCKFFYNNYYKLCDADLLPLGTAVQMFDTAVNEGVHESKIFLQRALCVKEDGIIGKETLDKLSHISTLTLLNVYAEMRAKNYEDISKAKPSEEPFLKDWLRRVREVQRYAQTYVV